MNTNLQNMLERLPEKLKGYFKKDFVDYHLRKIGESEIDWRDYEFHKKEISIRCCNSKEYDAGIRYLVEVLGI